MELIDSYLHEVSRHLPVDQRQDVTEDLRAVIEEEVYGSAGDNPITDEHQAEVLARFGHPLKVAGQYAPRRALIGPELFPAFVQTLKVILTIALVAQFVVALGVALANDWQVGPFEFVFMTLETLLWVAAVVVGVFIAIEYSGEKLGWYERWQPQTLAKGNLGVADRGDVITNLITEGFFLLWWNDVIVLDRWFPALQDTVSLGASWGPYFWCFNVVFGLCFVLHAYVLVIGLWRFRALVAEIVLNAAVAALGVTLAFESDLIQLGDAVTEVVSGHIDNVVRMVILVIVGFTLWDVWLAFKTLRGEVR